MEFLILLGMGGLLFYLWSRIGELHERLIAQEQVIAEVLVELRSGARRPLAVPTAAAADPAGGTASVERPLPVEPVTPRPWSPATSPVQDTAEAASTRHPPLQPEPARPAALAARENATLSMPVAGDAGKPSSGQTQARDQEHRSQAAPSAPRQGLEELIGTQWAVWVGGIALALGAVLLVRYSIEAGFFGPAFRVGLGAALALGLAAGGEWLRRAGGSVPAFPGADVPAILTAAATVAAFATTYSAHALYGFIATGPAFALMGLVGLATLGAALLHGPALAGLGLAASFATPLLVTPSAIPNPWPVVVYLLVVASAAFVLARIKGWPWLSAASGAGGIVWGLMLVGKAEAGAQWWPPAMLHTLGQLLVAAAALAVMVRPVEGESEEERDVTATAVFAGFGLLSILVLVANHGLSLAAMTFAAIAMAVLVLVARSRPRLAFVATAAAMLVFAYALLWPAALPGRVMTAPSIHELVFPLPMQVWTYGIFMALAAVLVALVSAEGMLHRPQLPLWSASAHASVAVVLPLTILMIANARLTMTLTSPWAALAAAVLAIAFAAGALRFQAEERPHPVDAIRLGTGALAAGSVAAVVLALLFWLEQGYLTVALAGAAFATALAADARRIPVLRSAVCAIGIIVLVRLAMDPLIMGPNVGTWPVLNWLLLGYGGPAVAFFAAARLLEREKNDGTVGVCDALALLFAGLLVFMQIRHALHGGAMLTAPADHAEQGLMAFTAFGGSYALMQLRSLRANPVFRIGSIVLATIATVSAILTLGLVNNPVLVNGEPITGGIALNSLMLAYLLPGGMAAWLAWNMRAAERPEWLITLVAMAAVGLIVGFALLELRFWFHGADVRAIKGAGHVEIGLMLALVMAALIALTGLAMMRRTDAVSMVTLTLTAVAGLMLLGGLGSSVNPLFTGERVVGPVFLGSLAAAYLLPAIAAAILAWHAREPWPRGFVLAIGAVAVLAVFGWVTLSVRHLFQGPVIAYTRPTTEMEIWAYSAAWLVLGLMLLGYGMARGVLEARAVSAVFVVLTVLKVFLLDLAGLSGFWRAISFIGLGLVLIGIGLAYQRVLFAKAPDQPDRR